MTNGNDKEIVMRIQKRYNIFVTAVLLLLSAVGFILNDMVYRPKDSILFIVAFGVVWTLTVYGSVALEKYACTDAKICGAFMPVTCFIYYLSLTVILDMSGDELRENPYYRLILCGILIVASVVVFFSYCRGREIRSIAVVMTILVILIFGFFSFVAVLFADFGETEVREVYVSPDGAYFAKTVSYCEGAMGGDTVVEIEKTKQIPLISGTIVWRNTKLWVGDWGYTPEVEWTDENTLVIDGQEYVADSCF